MTHRGRSGKLIDAHARARRTGAIGIAPMGCQRPSSGARGGVLALVAANALELLDRRLFPAAIVSTGAIALLSSGRQHAGENFSDSAGDARPALPRPIHMSDELDRNIAADAESVLSSKCLAHSRRHFVGEVENHRLVTRRDATGVPPPSTWPMALITTGRMTGLRAAVCSRACASSLGVSRARSSQPRRSSVASRSPPPALAGTLGRPRARPTRARPTRVRPSRRAARADRRSRARPSRRRLTT